MQASFLQSPCMCMHTLCGPASVPCMRTHADQAAHRRKSGSGGQPFPSVPSETPAFHECRFTGLSSAQPRRLAARRVRPLRSEQLRCVGGPPLCPRAQPPTLTKRRGHARQATHGQAALAASIADGSRSPTRTQRPSRACPCAQPVRSLRPSRRAAWPT